MEDQEIIRLYCQRNPSAIKETALEYGNYCKSIARNIIGNNEDAEECVSDTVYLGFYHDYYEDGSPKLTEDVAAKQGFYIMASKVGLLSDCIYILPENEVQTSEIGGTEVTFGYRSMPYGPYDPDTHQPSGYYDMYVAEFECDGIGYQVVAEQMGAEEVVKVVSSIICGEEVVIDG